MPVDYIGRKC